ncbi:MAG: acetyltransferase [Acidobacteriota bacterium]
MISLVTVSGRVRLVGGLAVALLLCADIPAQTLLSAGIGPVHLVGSDLAVLEAQDVRKEISCTVTPQKPALGFDLRYHAGFNVTVPLKELSGEGNSLTILFRVTSQDPPAEPVYFIQRYTVPSIVEDAGGDALLQGSLDLGEGKYHVDWMMRDRLQQVCSSYWDMEAALASKDRDMKLETPLGAIEAAHVEQFAEEPPVARVLDKTPLKIKVLVNFAPQNSAASTMRPQDTSALVSILRQLDREPQFGKYSVVAFNIQEQRVFYTQDSEDSIDFPALGEALSTVKLGIVDAAKLQNKHGDTEFLTELIQKEMSADNHPDALIFAGPKLMLDASVPQEALKPLTDVDYPIFYMNYSLNPQEAPWRDSIGRAIRLFRGTEFTITRPRDLWYSISDMVSRIVKSNYSRLSIRGTE